MRNRRFADSKFFDMGLEGLKAEAGRRRSEAERLKSAVWMGVRSICAGGIQMRNAEFGVRI